ncbi:NAD(P)H-dependent oxidoreductase [Rossellomorea vietnamensis]|uniref:NAD(P)H-dependent oxidoreductase n=1 Tax=Rossellomorea vietnamensis TaxID=218284 RepID=UPI001E51F876|nr:NAD(P)H-dependent oxidoreductase [Rossellomorea vietnamensis]MCC5802847.1 NAD(P)H-dependent oxidoreductase [Rossellomorea vietnamensis]
MKTLVLVGHPAIEESRMNKAWADRLEKEENITVHHLYKEYPDMKIDVEREQHLLLGHDRIVFQFPFYWYSTPAILKEWQDQVLQYGWAYGSEGTKLHGKEFLVVTSTGGPAGAYQSGGYNHYSMSELLKPLQAMANLTGMTFLPAYAEQGVRMLSDEEVSISAEKVAAYVRDGDLKRGR